MKVVRSLGSKNSLHALTNFSAMANQTVSGTARKKGTGGKMFSSSAFQFSFPLLLIGSQDALPSSEVKSPSSFTLTRPWLSLTDKQKSKLKIVDLTLLSDKGVRMDENSLEVEVKTKDGKAYLLRAGGKQGTEEECWALYRVLKNSTMAEQEAFEGGDSRKKGGRMKEAPVTDGGQTSSYSGKPSSRQMHRVMMDVMEKSQINVGDEPQSIFAKRSGQSESSESDDERSDGGNSPLEALCFTADSYYYGIGNITVNHQAAYAAYERASNEGSAYAMVALAGMILREEGSSFQGNITVRSSPAFNRILAKKWYSKAISSFSDRTAQYELGKILLDEGISSKSRDDVKFEEGMGLIKLASRQGHVEAMVVLGRYAQEQGNAEEAAGMFKAAAKKGSAEGSNELGMCYYGGVGGKGIGVEQSFTDAFECYSAAATRGSAAGWCNLGMMYELGKGMMERDIGVAIKCYEHGAESGNVKAMSCLGRLLVHTATVDAAFGTSVAGGRGSDAFERAILWLRKAAELGDAAASYELGCVYYKGMGGWSGNVLVPVDLSGALSHFKMACRLSTEDAKASRKQARQNSAFPLGQAALMAADMLYAGDGVSGEEDLAYYRKEAYRYYKMSAGTGNVQAMNSLGIMTEQEGDEFQALELYVRGMKSEERCWAGYCAYNMVRMCEPYICNDLLFLPEDLGGDGGSGGGSMEMKSHQEKVKLKRRSAAIRVRLSELLTESVKKDDLEFCLNYYNKSVGLGCPKGGADVHRIETKLRRREELAELVQVGAVVDGGVDNRVTVVGSGVGAEGLGEGESMADRLRSDGSAAKAGSTLKVPSSPGKRRPSKRERQRERERESGGSGSSDGGGGGHSMVASPPEKRSGGTIATPSPRVIRTNSIGSAGSLLEGIKASAGGSSRAGGEEPQGGGGGGILAGIYYTSPEPEKEKEKEVPKAVLTDDEDSGGDGEGEEEEEDVKVESKPAKAVAKDEKERAEPGQPVLRKRYADLEGSSGGGAGKGKGGEHSHHHHTHRHHHEASQPPPGVQDNIDKKNLPSPPHVAKAEDDWDDIKIGAISPPSSSGTGSSGSSDESSGEWFYVDKKGDKQGPFNSSIINDWTTAGYLPMDLKVKHGENSKVFKSLGEVWNQSFGIDKTFFEDEDEDVEGGGKGGRGEGRKRGGSGGTKRVEDINIGAEMTPIKRSGRTDDSF